MLFAVCRTSKLLRRLRVLSLRVGEVEYLKIRDAAITQLMTVRHEFI